MSNLTKVIPIGSTYALTSSILDYNDIVGFTGATVSTAGSIVFSNISFTDIKSQLSGTSFSLSVLSKMTFNSYALFKPDGVAPYNVSEFCGYNPYAFPPTYFKYKPTLMNINKVYVSTNVYSFTLSLLLNRGELLPTVTSSSWSYVRTKAVITDTVNNRTITVYSNSTAIDFSGTTIALTYYDNNNYDISGTCVFSAEYLNSASTLLGSIEDTSFTTNLTVNGIYPTYNYSNFTLLPTVRLYYINTANSNSLAYIDLVQSSGTSNRLKLYSGTTMGNSFIYGMYGTDASSGTTIAQWLDPPTDNVVFWKVVIYNGTSYFSYTQTSGGGGYYTTGQVVDGYRVGTNINTLTKFAYISTASAWPTSYP
jgi:hypothetical protein